MLNQGHTQSHTQNHRITTAHLAQTMSLLELTTAELRQKIESELAHNPALELVDESRCPTCHRLLHGIPSCPLCTFSNAAYPEQPIVFLSSREDFYTYNASGNMPSEIPDDNNAPVFEDLPQYVMRQIAPELLPDDRLIAAHILTSLNEDGLLSITPIEIAQYQHVSLSRVHQVLHLIQRADPLGVGSPSPRDALLVQLDVLQETRSAPPLAAQAIREGFDLLSHHRYVELGRLLHISASQAKQLATFIGDNLNPFPARAHWGENSQAAHDIDPSTRAYHNPDIIISLLNDRDDTPLVVEIAMPFYGTLRVNPLFRQALNEAPSDKTELWQADIEKATLLVKCLQQRNNTIVRLMQQLVCIQRMFILAGDAYLLPITRARLAKQLDVHESTISRAVSEKTVQLPNSRIVPLAIFFDRSLQVRTALKKIIELESSPLNDNEIVVLLSKKGYQVARRTVAKYRSMEGILPAHLR